MAAMLAYKIFRAAEWQVLCADGKTDGAPVDRADGYIHMSTAAQVRETLARHFAGEAGLVLVAVDIDAAGDAIRWERSRGGADFPHLYRAMTMDDVTWHRPIALEDGRHVLPDGLA